MGCEIKNAESDIGRDSFSFRELASAQALQFFLTAATGKSKRLLLVVDEAPAAEK